MKGEEWEGEKEREQWLVNSVYHNGNERVCVCKINKLEKERGRESERERTSYDSISYCFEMFVL